MMVTNEVTRPPRSHLDAISILKYYYENPDKRRTLFSLL